MVARIAPLLFLLVACSKTPTAADVCGKLEEAGIAKASSCREEKPAMVSARASQRYDFDLVNVPGKGGQVLSFEADDDYTATVETFKAAAMLAGPHRYGNDKARIFVQMNDGVSLEEGKRAKALVEGL